MLATACMHPPRELLALPLARPFSRSFRYNQGRRCPRRLRIMARRTVQYELPPGRDWDSVVQSLGDSVRLQAEPVQHLQRTYLDSFDWRLYGRGWALAHDKRGTEASLYWLRLDSAVPERIQSIDVLPRFVSDLPPGPLRDELQAIVKVRALLPVMTVRGRIQQLRVVNKEDKTVLRIELQDMRASPPGSRRRPHALGQRVQLFPLRGYAGVAQRVRGVLEQTLDLKAAPDASYAAALRSVGVTPGGYSSSPRVALEPTMRADVAVKLILARLFEVIEANEAGLRADIDSEFLHDFRVAVRRTRAALGQLKGVFPKRSEALFRREFAWLGGVTSPTRDMDVYLLRYDDYVLGLAPALRAALATFRDFLVAHHRKEQAALVKALGSARYRRLKQRWRAFLDAPVAKRSSLPHARRPIGELASERIWRVYRRALKEGRAIDNDSPAEALHELRKTCKKLRYLMEFFTPLYPATRIRAPIKALKRLQDNLGDVQDFAVQAAALEHFSELMAAELKAPPSTLVAMGMLVEQLLQRQHEARRVFAACFAEFDTPDNHAKYQSLFKRASAAAGDHR